VTFVTAITVTVVTWDTIVKSIENILDDLRTFKEIQKNETLNQILNDFMINKPTVISFQNYDIINTQRIKYEYLSKFLYELLFLDDDD
jgi:hypothetical protein